MAENLGAKSKNIKKLLTDATAIDCNKKLHLNENQSLSSNNELFYDDDNDHTSNILVEQTLSLTNRFFYDSLCDLSTAQYTTESNDSTICSEDGAFSSMNQSNLIKSISETEAGISNIIDKFQSFVSNPELHKMDENDQTNDKPNLNYHKMMSSMAATSNQYRIGGGAVETTDQQLQKSIFSQSNVLSQYRLLVSDKSAPEIIADNGSTTVTTADIHTTSSGTNVQITKAAKILATLSSTVSSSPTTEQHTHQTDTDEEPIHPPMTLRGLIRTDGLQRDDSPFISDEESWLSEDDERRKKIKAKNEIQLPLNIEENQISIKETNRLKKKPKSWAFKNGLPPTLELMEHTNMILIEVAKEIPSNLFKINVQKEQALVFRNGNGDILYYGVEHPQICPIGICTSGRPFTMHIYDTNGVEVMLFQRRTSCLIGGCLVPCLWQAIKVYCPPPTLLGTVEEDITLLVPKFTVYDYSNVPLCILRGPIAASIFNQNIDFLLYKPDEFEHNGIITDNWWDDTVLNTYKTTFGIKYPDSVTVRTKIVLLGAALLTKYIYYRRHSVHCVPVMLPDSVDSTTVVIEQPQTTCVDVDDESRDDNGDKVTVTVPIKIETNSNVDNDLGVSGDGEKDTIVKPIIIADDLAVS